MLPIELLFEGRNLLTLRSPMYDIQPIDRSADGIAHCAALLDEVFPGGGFTPGYIDWQYNHNPAGPAVGFNAMANGQIAAHYVTIPVQALIDGQEHRGALSLNTATSAAHRRKKLFVRLANRTYDALAEDGYSFVVGVANENSTHGFEHKLGFQVVAPLDIKLGIGELHRAERPSTCEFESVWTRELIDWRIRNPNRRYRLARRDGCFDILTQVRGLWLQSLLGRFSDDLLPDSADVAGDGISWFARTSPFRLWVGLEPDIDWRRCTYFEIPARFRPSPLNLIFKDLTGGGRQLDAHRVRYSSLDFDVL